MSAFILLLTQYERSATEFFPVRKAKVLGGEKRKIKPSTN